MKKILLTSPLPAAFIQQVANDREITDVEVVEGHGLSGEDLKRAIKETEVVIGDFTFTTELTEEIITAAEKTKYILQPSVGYQHIDVKACHRAGITVANTAGANTVAVAEHTIAAALSLLKNTVRASATTLQGQWLQLEMKPGELMGKTWGIVGMGRIGQAVAERLLPFGVRILYSDPFQMNKDEEKRLQAEYSQLDELLKVSDIVSLHCPLTSDTGNLINEKSLGVMKQNALIINVSRGEVIDEKALSRALDQGTIAGAALDVFSEEPVSSENPLLKNTSGNLLLSPHVAGVSGESQLRIMAMTINNLVRVLAGEEPDNIVT